jgi:hypothetical protein
MTGERPLLAAKRLLAAESAGLLLLAAELLRTPQRFTRGAYARDGRGRYVQVDDPAAARFCLAGAVLCAEHRRYGTPIPIVTSTDNEVDDLLRPVLPEAAPARLQLALEILAWSAKAELVRLGRSYREIEADPEATERVATVLHYPLLLGLDRRAGYRLAYKALLSAVRVLATFVPDDAHLDLLVPDALVGGGKPT